jgi:hypothetical protein
MRPGPIQWEQNRRYIEQTGRRPPGSPFIGKQEALYYMATGQPRHYEEDNDYPDSPSDLHPVDDYPQEDEFPTPQEIGAQMFETPPLSAWRLPYPAAQPTFIGQPSTSLLPKQSP